MVKDPRGIHRETSEQLQEAVRQERSKAECFTRLFATSDGELVLTALKQVFDSATLCTAEPHNTVVNAAQRDVIKYIESKIQLGRGE